MNPFILGLFIMGLGVILGALSMWFYMDGRVEWYQEKYEMEKRLKDKLLEKNLEVLGSQLRIINDISSAIQTKGKAK
jgi:hypothetical protein